MLYAYKVFNAPGSGSQAIREVHHYFIPLNIFPISGSFGGRATPGVCSTVVVHLASMMYNIVWTAHVHLQQRKLAIAEPVIVPYCNSGSDVSLELWRAPEPKGDFSETELVVNQRAENFNRTGLDALHGSPLQ